MVRQALVYGLALGGLALLLDWLDYSHAMRLHSTQFYVVAIAVVFVGLGLWAGHRLTPAPRAAMFARNEAALAALGITDREAEVLTLIAAGQSNKHIARSLAISPNTVKTHVARLFEKLGVASRTQAVERARALDLLP